MKRMIIAILIVAAMLLVSGCAQNGDFAEDQIDDVVTEDTSEDTTEGMTEAPEDVGEGMDGTVSDPAEPVSDEEDGLTEPENISSITQEDLDKLKEELEGLEFEEMGGLSEE